ncbi:hypothetical protein [Vibrio coralliilyticus]|uniref:hypothetical protein n=1 Tax=Vibrio coralliilyticus TaxID=190893 RepID=UPI00156099F2|nr:hypothetical protein [Vibrio coralliilyticus]NRF16396.1 hypothetical protein [Vibrio coralliilyticus]
MKKVIIALCILFTSSAFGAEAISMLSDELEHGLGKCRTSEPGNLCFVSLDVRNGDVLVYLNSGTFKEATFDKGESALSIATYTNELYAHLDKRTHAFVSEVPLALNVSNEILDQIEGKVVLVVTYPFDNEIVTAIHDNNDTLYLGLEKRVDIYNLLREHRSRMSQNKKAYYIKERSGNYYTSVEHLELETTYSLTSQPALLDTHTGELINTGDAEPIEKQLKVITLIGYQVRFNNIKQG